MSPEGYLAEVERFWLLLRRRGLMISAAEVQLVLSWRDSGLPARIVCHALLEASLRYRSVHGPNEDLPSSLRYFQSAVEEAGRVYLTRTGASFPVEQPATAQPSSTDETAGLATLLVPLASAGRAERDPMVRAAYRNAYRRIQRLARTTAKAEAEGLDAEGAVIEALMDIDRALVDDAVEALDPEARAALDGEIEKLLARERARLGARGLEERRRALFERLATRHLRLWRLVPAPPNGPRFAEMGWAHPDELWQEHTS